jgi:transposase
MCYNSWMSKRGYSVDFRECVLAYVARGYSIKSASDIFQISAPTIYNWHKKMEETGACNPIIVTRHRHKKIEDSMLLSHIAQYPDATLAEISNAFSCRPVSVWRRLKILGITRKKNHVVRRA